MTKRIRDRGPSLQDQPYRDYTLADTSLARLEFVSDEERAALAKVYLSQRSLDPGEGLIEEGGMPDNLYFLAEGWAYRYIMTGSGTRQIPTILVPGDVCNLDNFLFPRSDCGVRAATEAHVLALPRQRAMALASEHPGVGRAFTWLALGENAILTQWAVGLGRRSARQRLAHLLCELYVRVASSPAGGEFELPLTQEMIADTLGLTPVHINRTMQKLRSGAMIAPAGRKVAILDIERLRELAEFDPSYLRQIERSAASPMTGAA
jgi:CRP-like cAMP-binding protein